MSLNYPLLPGEDQGHLDALFLLPQVEAPTIKALMTESLEMALETQQLHQALQGGLWPAWVEEPFRS